MSTAKQKLFSDTEYKEIFYQLHNLTKKYETSQPFIPVISEKWGEGPLPKIIWYGAAPYQWDESWDEGVYNFDTELGRSEDWVAQHLDRIPQSLFWRFQLIFLKRYNCNYDQSVWSNVFKIGGPKAKNNGNPSASLKKKQYDLCGRAFEIERDILSPDLIVLHTGEMTNKIGADLTNEWKSWEYYKVGGKDVAAYTVIDGTTYLWFTRDSKRLKEANYQELFSWLHEEIDCLSDWEELHRNRL